MKTGAACVDGICVAVRAVVCALIGLGACSALVGVALPAYDLNRLWIGEASTRTLADILLVGAAVALLLSRRDARRQKWSAGLVGALAVIAVADVARFYEALSFGSVQSHAPVPLSLGIALLLGFGALALLRVSQARVAQPRGHRLAALLIGIGCVPALLLALLMTLGSTDYRRPADVAVVFGAAVRPDGQASGALKDRIHTACDLYQQGLVQMLVLSGGADPRAPLSEPACMAKIARERGVPASALIWDESGLTTRATLDETRRLAHRYGWRRVLMVSHDYHLARIHIGAARRGITAFTVPARERQKPYWKPPAILREVAALAWYIASDV